jgi:hypothetical protein
MSREVFLGVESVKMLKPATNLLLKYEIQRFISCQRHNGKLYLRNMKIEGSAYTNETHIRCAEHT